MRTALIPGSFDPITLGHLDIVERSAALFDRVYVTVFCNSEKNTLFTAEERLDMVRLAVAHLPNVIADSSDGLLAAYAGERRAVLVKGVRNVSDYDYEEWLAAINRNMDEHLETIFLPASAPCRHISSTVVRELLRYGRDIGGYVPEPVREYIANCKKN